MTDRDKCPMCADGEVTRSEGKLDQSGTTYLPTVVWTCTLCGYVRYEPAPSARWRSLYESEAIPAAGETEDDLRRAAA